MATSFSGRRSAALIIYSAANYLTKSGVSQGPDGVRKAIFAYNHADWYVNDVLFYASRYGGGTVVGDPNHCGFGSGNPKLPPLTQDRGAKVLAWAKSQEGDSYSMGATGPDTWDCSSFTQSAYAQIGIKLPRTAARNAAGSPRETGSASHPARNGQET